MAEVTPRTPNRLLPPLRGKKSMGYAVRQNGATDEHKQI